MANFIKKALDNTVYSPKDGVLYWRERIFLNSSLVLILLGAVAVSIGVIKALKEKHPLLALIDAIAYQILLFIFFNRSLKLPIRILLFLVG